jgi:uncharacterized membrane protein
MHGVLTLALIVAVFKNWKDRPTRKLLLIGTIAYFAMRAWTFAYFIPEISAFMEMAPDAAVDRTELAARVAAWNNLSHGRTLLVLIMTACLFWAALRKFDGQERSSAPKR